MYQFFENGHGYDTQIFGFLNFDKASTRADISVRKFHRINYQGDIRILSQQLALS